jgi:hypothetical protein
MKKLLLITILFSPMYARAALPAAAVWEVRTTGSDSNGGCFKEGATGTDYTQQDAAQYTPTGMTTSGAAALIAYTSAAADMVGNCINITGGTNFIPGIYEIQSAVVGVSITVDRNATSGIGADGTGNIGGALLNPSKPDYSGITAGNFVWIKAGTYATSTKLLMEIRGDNTNGAISWTGYDAVRGDNTGTRPVITTAVSGLALVDIMARLRVFNNLKFTHTGSTRGYAFESLTSFTYGDMWINCIFDGMLSAFKMDNQGAWYNGAVLLIDSQVINSTSQGIRANAGVIIRSVIANNASDGIYPTDNSNSQYFWVIEDNLIYGNGGKGIHNYGFGSFIVFARHNTIYNNAGDGIGGVGDTMGILESNIIYGNGAYGTNFPAITVRGIVGANNAYGANVTAASSTAFTSVYNEKVLTGNPFTNAASGDFSLNNTAGAGALLRGAGLPGVFAGGLSTGYSDIGAIQHQAVGGATTPQRAWVY